MICPDVALMYINGKDIKVESLLTEDSLKNPTRV